MINKRMQEIYDDCFDRFNKTKDYDDRACLEDIIEWFQKYVGPAHPYLYTILYLDSKYEEFVTLGAFKISEDYKKWAINNKDFLTGIFSNFVNLELKDKVDNNTLVPNTDEIVGEFFKTMDMDLYNLFINSKNNIFRVYDHSGGKALYDPVKDQVYVLFGKEHNFRNMVTLVHEMGHCFKDHLIKKVYSTNSVEEHLKSELYSEIIEHIFAIYLVNNDIYAIDAYDHLNNTRNEIIEVSRKLSDAIIVNDDSSTLHEIKYLLGRILAYYYIESGMSLKEIFMDIHNHTTLEILSNPNIDYQEISNKLNKNYCLKKQ